MKIRTTPEQEHPAEPSPRIGVERVDPKVDEHGVPFVRLTRTVQTGFGLAVGFAMPWLIIGLVLIILRLA